VRRTQLYLDEDLWKLLHTHARSSGTTISDLVRQAVRERYAGNLNARRKAMQAFVGIWRDRPEMEDTEAYVREMRRNSRLDRLRRR
jgi:hypothetical protein